MELIMSVIIYPLGTQQSQIQLVAIKSAIKKPLYHVTKLH